MRRLPVVAEHDFLEGLVRDPVTGLVEVVWNALDADATEVSITVIDNGAEGVAAVRDGRPDLVLWRARAIPGAPGVF